MSGNYTYGPIGGIVLIRIAFIAAPAFGAIENRVQFMQAGRPQRFCIIGSSLVTEQGL